MHSSMDRVLIEQLSVFTRIGVYDWEQSILQKLVFDIEMAWDNCKAAATDNVQDCLNYEAVSAAILDYVSSRAFALIERVAEETATLLISEFNVPWVKVKVGKPCAVPQAAQVSVVVQRGRLT